MNKRLTKPEQVTWRGPVKRQWFKRDRYTYRVNGETFESAPAKWHAGVDVIQTRTAHRGYPDNPMFDKVEMHVRALCGYVYSFDFILANNHYGRASYRDSIKTNVCSKCQAELEKPREKRSANKWIVPPTEFHESYDPLTEGGTPWWPSDNKEEQ